MKVGLVLEGGAMRGMYTAGALDVFLDNDLPISGVVGVSAGALFGVNYVSKQRGRAIRYNKEYNKDPNYMGIRPFLQEGNWVSTRYAYEEVPHWLDPFDDETFKASATPFYAVVTNLKSGSAEYVQIKSVFEQMDALRASGSMPFLSKPVEIAGERYLDGAVADSIPFQWMKEQGYDKLLVILTREAGYRKQAIPKAAIRLYFHRYPQFAQRLMLRHQMYNEQLRILEQWGEEGKAWILRPSKAISIKRVEKNPDALQRVYELGVSDAQARMNELRHELYGE